MFAPRHSTTVPSVSWTFVYTRTIPVLLPAFLSFVFAPSQFCYYLYQQHHFPLLSCLYSPGSLKPSVFVHLLSFSCSWGALTLQNNQPTHARELWRTLVAELPGDCSLAHGPCGNVAITLLLADVCLFRGQLTQVLAFLPQFIKKISKLLQVDFSSRAPRRQKVQTFYRRRVLWVMSAPRRPRCHQLRQLLLWPK